MSFAEFVIKYWMLWGLAAGLLVALLGTFIPELIPGAPQISPTEVTRLINRERAIVLDLRAPEAHAVAHLPGALPIDPVREADRLRALVREKSRPVVLHFDDVSAGNRLYASLTGQGVERVFRLRGGLEAWRAASLPLSGSGTPEAGRS